MCRYGGFSWYPTSWVCVPCRHVAQYVPEVAPRCPRCRGDMLNLGRDFHAPRKRDDAGWRAVAAVVASGKRYDSCGCNGPGPRPSTSAEVRRDSFVRPWKPRGLR